SHLQRARQGRQGRDAGRPDVLRQALRRRHRQVRRQLDDHDAAAACTGLDGSSRHATMAAPSPDVSRCPQLPLAPWQDTRSTLHLWTQIVGKIRLAQTPWLNHSWHAALYVTARGLTTSPIPVDGRTVQIDFDFVDHVLWVRTSDGHFRQVMLAAKSVAE